MIIDTPYSVAGHAHELAEAGVLGVIRYVSPNTKNFPTKQITKEELDGLRSVGIRVGFVYEQTSGLSEFHTPDDQAGTISNFLKNTLELPNDQSIQVYRAIDYDAPLGDIQGPIMNYFETFHETLKNHGFLTSGYGSWMTLRKLLDAGVIHSTWLAGSPAWSNYDIATPDLKQLNVAIKHAVCGFDVDLNESTGKSFSQLGFA